MAKKHAPSQIDRKQINTLHAAQKLNPRRTKEKKKTKDSLQRILAVKELVVVVRTFRELSRFVTSEELGEILQHRLVLGKWNKIVVDFGLDYFRRVLPSLQN
jgi:hypothetical protein